MDVGAPSAAAVAPLVGAGDGAGLQGRGEGCVLLVLSEAKRKHYIIIRPAYRCGSQLCSRDWGQHTRVSVSVSWVLADRAA
jgi:hypothetical protein